MSDNRRSDNSDYCTKMKSEAGKHPCSRVNIILVPRPLFTSVAQKLCIHEQNACSFSSITSHRNRLLLLMKHLAVRILRRKYQIRQNKTPTGNNISGHRKCLFARGDMSDAGQRRQA
jgi:hypothetical protein